MRTMQGERGFTLVELMMLTILMPFLAFSIYSIMTMASTVLRTTDTYARLNQGAMQTLRYISREIGQSSPNMSPSHLSITTVSGNSVVRFQIPVDWDNDGDVVTASSNPSVEWGAYDEANQKVSGRLNAWVRYSVSSNQLIREVLDSSLNPISGLSRVVASNVQTFTVTQSINTLSMNITLQNNANVQGGTMRTFQTAFNSNTLLRNAVS